MTTITTGPDGEALFDGMSVQELIAWHQDFAARLANFCIPGYGHIPLLTAAALRHLSALNEWQPIETAPRDGNNILLFWCGVVRMGFWLDNSKTMQAWDGWVPADRKSFRDNPTHWRPLPAPPGGEK